MEQNSSRLSIRWVQRSPLRAVKPQSRRKTLNVLKQSWETLQNLWPSGACERFMRLEGFWGALLCGLLQVAPQDPTALLAGINVLLEPVLLWVSEWHLTPFWGTGQFCCRAAITFCDPLHHQSMGRPLACSASIPEDWYSFLETTICKMSVQGQKEKKKTQPFYSGQA